MPKSNTEMTYQPGPVTATRVEACAYLYQLLAVPLRDLVVARVCQGLFGLTCVLRHHSQTALVLVYLLQCVLPRRVQLATALLQLRLRPDLRQPDQHMRNVIPNMENYADGL